MKSQNKIIFTGPVGAGKTTAIATISDTAIVSTEQKATDETKDKKELTTVAMDYGSMRLNNGETIHLYGTPGQKRFDFMRDILCEGGIGLIIMLDHSDPDSTDKLHGFIDSFRNFIQDSSLVVGVTHVEAELNQSLKKYHEKLNELNFVPAVFEVDARSHDDVMMLVQALLYSLDPGMSAA